jgi:prepilin-type N-terminal cleavage/methylation domain-containing protein
VRRNAFTLIEVMVALVVTGLVVSLAYGAAQAGFDTEDRLDAHRAGQERAAAMRTLLADALRHQVEGVRGGDEVFALTDRVAPGGGSADSLCLTTRGMVAPLGGSEAWNVSLWLAGDTLQLLARPLAGGVPVEARLGKVRTFDVQALGRGLAAGWSGTWPDGDVAPDAVSLTLGHAALSPSRLVVRRGLERAP